MYSSIVSVCSKGGIDGNQLRAGFLAGIAISLAVGQRLAFAQRD
jgi:hypothetical protein